METRTGRRPRSTRGLVAVPLIGVLALALLAPAWLAGARAQEPETVADSGLLRFVHASPDAPDVDIYVDGTLAVPALRTGDATEFIPVDGGERQVQVVPVGGAVDDAVLETEVEVEDNTAYEVIVFNVLAEIEAKTLEINQDRIEGGTSARVRVIHAIPDAEEVDVVVTGGEPLFEGVEFGDDTDYTDVQAGTYDLEVRRAGEDEVLFSVAGAELRPGYVYDLVAVGQAASQSLALLTLEAAAEVACSAVIGVGTDADACVRVVHASPDAPDVDVYLDDGAEPIVTAMSFGTANEFAAIPAGEHRVRVVATGAAPDTAVVDEEYEFEEGRAYQVAAVNVLDDIAGELYEVNLAPLGEDQARLRVVHASPDAGEIDVAVAGGDILFEEAGFPDATDYLDLPAGSYDLEVRQGEEVALSQPGVELEAGTVYDVFAIGQAEENTLQLLPLTAPSASSPDSATNRATPPAPTEAPVETIGATPAAATPAG